MAGQSSLWVAVSLVVAWSGSAWAEKADPNAIKCDVAAKKMEWHMCVVAPVEYKHGIKEFTSNECKVDKIVKVSNGCDLGNLMTQIPADIDPNKVLFYGIGPDSLWEKVYDKQFVQDVNTCKLEGTVVEAWQTIKLSDAWEKNDAERSEMVKEKLRKKKLALFSVAVGIKAPAGCSGKSAKFAMVDKLTLSNFLFLATATFKK